MTISSYKVNKAILTLPAKKAIYVLSNIRITAKLNADAGGEEETEIANLPRNLMSL